MTANQLLICANIALASCQAPVIEPNKSVILVVHYGDLRKVYIRNDGIECWIYEGNELIGKEKW